ncbi:MAG: THUMP domain-containing class I SAM-dependent RNA methyltransferase [Candidatus Zhuqueibacterota bacterium]
MFEYQKTNGYFAQVTSGMEDLAVDELSRLGAERLKSAFRGLYFEADKATLYRINYESRFLTNILAPLNKFNCHDTKYLYRKARAIEWDSLISVDQTFAIHANVANSKITHSQYAGLCVKDAIVDFFRDKTGRRPNVERNVPDAWINLHIDMDFATISFETSGGSLHRRGYRKEAVEAPMQETVAAAIIQFTEWDGAAPLVDPFCGSGTLLCEALMAYCRIPAGFLRKKFGFQSLPDFDEQVWQSVKTAADSNIRELPAGLISGSDILPSAVAVARVNLASLPGGKNVEITVSDFQSLPDLDTHVIVCNPPYGIRMGNPHASQKIYKSFGDFLKQRCRNSTAYVYFGDRSLIPAIGLKPTFKRPLRNAGLDGRLVKIDLY